MSAFHRSIAGQTFLLLLAGIVGTAVLLIGISALHVHHPMLLALFAGCILALAYVVSIRVTRTLRNLAAAATRLGSDINSEPLEERGPTEVREAATAFNAMQRRIRRDVLERTSMLAAITHDLQTPMTRLRLRLEKVEDEALREKLIADLAAMREMANQGLDLARSLDAPDAAQRVDLDSLVASVCEDARDAGEPVTYDGSTGASVLCAPGVLRRCITNLVDNALRYGRVARVSALADGTHTRIVISDEGPGIAPEHVERVFDPFFRLEASRSRETGGSGLGLTIARNIARRYGGDVTMANRPDGGLSVTLTLPMAAERA